MMMESEITRLERSIALLQVVANKTLDGSIKDAMIHAIEVMKAKLAQMQSNLAFCGASFNAIKKDLAESCVDGFSKPSYCDKRNLHLCEKCKDW